MNYTLHQLNIFNTLVAHKNITKAAEILHVSQPAVSIQLKKFQEQFKVPLFEIIGRQLFITDFGYEIAETVKELLQKAEEMESLAHAFEGEITGKIKISSVSTGKYVMPYFLGDFFMSNPAVELQMDVTNKQKVVESIRTNEVDFALVSIIPPDLNVVQLDLMKNRLFLIAPKQFDIKSKATLPELIEDYPLILREAGSGTRQSMEQFFNTQNLSIKRKLELSSNEAVKQAVMAGLGISIMPIIGIRNELMLGSLKVIQISDLPIETTWSLIWNKGKRHSPAAKAILNYIMTNKNAIIAQQFK